MTTRSAPPEAQRRRVATAKPLPQPVDVRSREHGRMPGVGEGWFNAGTVVKRDLSAAWQGCRLRNSCRRVGFFLWAGMACDIGIHGAAGGLVTGRRRFSWVLPSRIA